MSRAPTGSAAAAGAGAEAGAAGEQAVEGAQIAETKVPDHHSSPPSSSLSTTAGATTTTTTATIRDDEKRRSGRPQGPGQGRNHISQQQQQRHQGQQRERDRERERESAKGEERDGRSRDRSLESQLSALLRWLQIKKYQYEVTFSLYMLTATEKMIFSTSDSVSLFLFSCSSFFFLSCFFCLVSALSVSCSFFSSSARKESRFQDCSAN
jgi:hypothetical protein